MLLAQGCKATRASIEALLSELAGHGRSQRGSSPSPSSSSTSTDSSTDMVIDADSSSSSSSSTAGLSVNVPEAGRLQATLNRTQALDDRILARMARCEQAVVQAAAASSAALCTPSASDACAEAPSSVNAEAAVVEAKDADAMADVSSDAEAVKEDNGKLTLEEMQDLVDEVRTSYCSAMRQICVVNMLCWVFNQASTSDVCALDSAAWQKLCDIRAAALEWDARARALLAKDYPRLHPLRAAVADAQNEIMLLVRKKFQNRLLVHVSLETDIHLSSHHQHVVFDHVDALSAKITLIESKLSEADELLQTKAELPVCGCACFFELLNLITITADSSCCFRC